ncbi:hypothetical protein C8R46DRAFT_1075789, partial [Mycena filopes]
DNMFPGAGQPRLQVVNSLISGVYQSSWRILVLCLATINALRFYLCATEALADLRIDLAQHNPQLARISKALATIYTVACGIEVLGALSAFLQHRALIRAYSYLAFVSAALITTAGVSITVAYFTYADALMQECVALATAGNLTSKSLFRGPPWPNTPLSSSEAQTQCLALYSSESPAQILSIALYYFLPSLLLASIAYIYHRQTTDPAHPAHLGAGSSTRRSAIRLEARGSGAGYGRVPTTDNNAEVTARPGLGKRRATVSPRSYGARAALAVTSLSPGPPSFSVAGASLAAGDYHGFYLSDVDEDEDGAFI